MKTVNLSRKIAKFFAPWGEKVDARFVRRAITRTLREFRRNGTRGITFPGKIRVVVLDPDHIVVRADRGKYSSLVFARVKVPRLGDFRALRISPNAFVEDFAE